MNERIVTFGGFREVGKRAGARSLRGDNVSNGSTSERARMLRRDG